MINSNPKIKLKFMRVESENYHNRTKLIIWKQIFKCITNFKTLTAKRIS